ncbi:MAG TPA: spore germination protein [Symbiobacteriaceae bacterium]|nr:spore germination protein [Symbiobacteriaceae bacterium]
MLEIIKELLFGGEPVTEQHGSKSQTPDPAPSHVVELAPLPTPLPMETTTGTPSRSSLQSEAESGGRPHVAQGGGLSQSLSANLKALKQIFGTSADITYRPFVVGGLQLGAALIYLDGMVDGPSINEFVLRPLMQRDQQLLAISQVQTDPLPSGVAVATNPLLLQIQHMLVFNGALAERTLFTQIVDDVLAGLTVLLIDTMDSALAIPLQGYEERSVSEPPTEALVRGPRDGFIESIRINMSLLRRKLKDPNLRMEIVRVGRRTNTEVAICFIQDVANPKLVNEIRTRIKGIDIDGILESGYLEQIIEDHHFSPFPQIQNTERADRAVANLLEGRVVVLVDGTPFCLILPSVFNQFYQAPEDYYERFLIATMIRGIRIISLFFSLTFTSLYVALISFHAEMLPTKFAVAVAGGRAGVPFPSVAEAFFMELSMEILREAALRLPKAIGPTVSIVGALVIGEASVRAGIVSPLMVIVVALTSIGSFAVPSYSAAIALRIVKFPIILAAGTFGLYGVMLAVIGLVVHLASLKSVGVPYLAPFAPMKPEDVKDTIFRLPLWAMTKRPATLRTQDATRQPHAASLLGAENLGIEGESGHGQPER